MASEASKQGTLAGGIIVLLLMDIASWVAAIGLTALAVWPVGQWYQSRHWVEVPASITAAQWTPEESWISLYPYVQGEFTYNYRGTRHISRRVTIDAPRLLQNSSAQETFYRQMMKAHQADQPLSCWVNPDRPGEAILFRNIPPLAVAAPSGLAVAFGAVALGLLIRIFRHRRAQGTESTIQPPAEASPTIEGPASDGVGVVTETAPDSVPQADSTLHEAPHAAATVFDSLETTPPPSSQIQCHVDSWGNRWLQIACWPGLPLFAMVVLLALAATGSFVLIGLHALAGHRLELLAAIAVALVAALLWRTVVSFVGSYHLRLDRADLHVVRDFKVFAKQRVISLPYIQTVQYVARITRGRSRYFSVYVRFADGQSICVAHGVRGEHAAHWLVDAILSQMQPRHE